MYYENEAVLPRSNTFLNQVFFYFALALLVTGVGTYFAPVLLPPTPLAFYGCMAAELILVFTARQWSRKKPLNIFLFAVFALLSGITLYPILAMAAVQGGTTLISQALFSTFLMFTAAAVYGNVTQKDLSSLGGILMMTLIGLIIVGILQIFWFNSFVELLASGVGIILFSVYTAYDIQQIKRYPTDLAIEAALRLYLDIFNLFVFILRFMLALTRD